ncbi:MAG TPA: rhodanese-like domain-containing protein [Acidimicrobiales bacterium]
MKTITRTELQNRLGSIVLLEALPRNYFEAEHLPGARNMPRDEIDALASLLVPDKGAAVVTYCAGPSCPNSKIAAERLETLGYTEVYAYEGGKEEWLAAGLPFEQGLSDTAA